MICKICGCEMKNNGDWFACPTCGSVHFGPDPDEDKNTAQPPVKKDEPSAEIDAAFIEKEESSFNFEEEFLKKDDPSILFTQTSMEEEEPPVKIAEPVIETAKPADNIVPEPDEEQENHEDDGTDLTSIFDDPPVKPNSFTDEKAPTFDDFASFSNYEEAFSNEEPPIIEEEEEEKPKKTKQKKSKGEKGENNKKEKKSSKLKDAVDFMLPIIAAIAIAFVLKTFIIANAKVPTGSMIATINIEDRIIASRLAYRTDSPQRYDIVLFYFPDNENDIFVKRVIGLPGETLEVIDGIAYVTTKDGKMIQTDQSFANPDETPSGNFGPYYIPEKGEAITFDGNYCYAENGMMIGQEGFLDKYCVLDEYGNYVIAENLYFMMGDNRNQSLDSRSWTFSFVAEDKIIGKVLFKYYPSFEKIE